MKTEYSVEEVRAHAAILRDWRDGFDPGVGNDDAAGMLDAHADLLERIKADEVGVPVAWQQKRRPEDYPDEWRECSKETFDTIKRTKNSPWIVRELFEFLPNMPRALPDGWVMAPREPTREMLAAVHGSTCGVRVAEDDYDEYPLSEDECAEIYRSMLAAGAIDAPDSKP